MRSSAADDESKDGQPPPEAPATGALRGALRLKGTLGRWRECFCELALREGADDQEAREAALALPAVQRRVDGKPVRKLVHVPGRIVNIIV